MRPIKSLGEKSGRKIVDIRGRDISINGNFSGLYLPGDSITEDRISNIFLQHQSSSGLDTPPLLIVSFEENRIEDAFIFDLMRILRIIGQTNDDPIWGGLAKYFTESRKQSGWTFEGMHFSGFPAIQGETALEDLLIMMGKNSKGMPIQNQILSLQARLRVIKTLLARQN